jgi:hypothetical protein
VKGLITQSCGALPPDMTSNHQSTPPAHHTFSLLLSNTFTIDRRSPTHLTPRIHEPPYLGSLDKMAIENAMMETQQVKTYAVCCTADLKIEVRKFGCPCACGREILT